MKLVLSFEDETGEQVGAWFDLPVVPRKGERWTSDKGDVYVVAGVSWSKDRHGHVATIAVKPAPEGP